MDCRRWNSLRGLGVFGLWGLVLGPFVSRSALTPLVLDAPATAFRQWLAGTTPLPGPHRLGTTREQRVALTAFPVRPQAQVLGALHLRSDRSHPLFKPRGVLVAALLSHQTPAGPFQHEGRPADRVRWVNPLPDHGVDLIPFNRQWDEGMAQTVAHPREFHPANTAFPLGHRVLVRSQHSSRRLPPPPCSAPPPRCRYLAERRLNTVPVEGPAISEKTSPPAPPGVAASDPVVNRRIATLAGGVTGTADRAN